MFSFYHSIEIDRILHQFEIKSVVNKEDADNYFRMASSGYRDLIKTYISESISKIQNDYLSAELHYKNLDDSINRIRCLIGLGRLNMLRCDKTYYNPSNKFFNSVDNFEEEIRFRLRSIEYALEISQALNSLTSKEIAKFKYKSEFLKDVSAYLQNNKTFFIMLKKEKDVTKIIKQMNLVNAEDLIDHNLNRIQELNRDISLIPSTGFFDSSKSLAEDQNFNADNKQNRRT